MVFSSARPATADDVAEFATWRYEPPFDVYDLGDAVADEIDYFTSPATRCHVVDTDDGLAGYCTFGEDARVPGGDYSAPALDIGTALRPALTGRGFGIRFIGAVIDFAAGAFGPTNARVSIAATNARALRVWQAHGFAETQRFHTDREVLGTTEFVVLERFLGAEG